MKALLDWIFTIPFVVAFGLILLVFDVAQRIARVFGRRPHEYVFGALQWSLMHAFGICGTRLRIDRSPRVRPHTPYLIIANHQSMFDIPILSSLMFTNFPKYISKRELARWIPSISYNLRRGGNAIIDRSDRGQALAAIRTLGEEVHHANRRYGNFWKTYITELVQKRDEHKMDHIFDGNPVNHPEPSIKETLKAAKPYLDDSFEGEAVLSIGKCDDYVKKGCSGLVNVMPFTCMPGTIVGAVMKRYREDHHNIPFLNMAYDGQEETNTLTGLEAFMHQARQYQRQLLEKK